MTYKAIVKNFIEKDARDFVETVSKENGYDIFFATSDAIKMENSKEYNTIFWEVETEIYFMDRRSNVKVIVGGTADDLCGICCSVIWDRNKKNILWMTGEQVRKDLNIKAFNI